ncbi:hypothetical protein FM109_00475 [Vibrio casei]|nr:hypothetical protein FM109_00475 [Vibrio casei]
MVVRWPAGRTPQIVSAGIAYNLITPAHYDAKPLTVDLVGL